MLASEHFPNLRELLRTLKGVFFLMKKTRCSEVSVYSHSGNAAWRSKEEKNGSDHSFASELKL
jgi:hypothetical protein